MQIEHELNYLMASHGPFHFLHFIINTGDLVLPTIDRLLMQVGGAKIWSLNYCCQGVRCNLYLNTPIQLPKTCEGSVSYSIYELETTVHSETSHTYSIGRNDMALFLIYRLLLPLASAIYLAHFQLLWKRFLLTRKERNRKNPKNTLVPVLRLVPLAYGPDSMSPFVGASLYSLDPSIRLES
jgi:hypothetical protein